jgi:hypothetical protein
VSYAKQAVNLKELLERACNHLGVSIPKVLKGVKGLTNETKTPEIIEKGILRAKYDLVSLQGWNNTLRRNQCAFNAF